MLIILLFSCTEKPQSQQENTKVTLNVTNPGQSGSGVRKNEQATSPGATPETPPQASSEPQPALQTSLYLSGRTEMLSLSPGERIAARGMDLGDLFFERDSPPDELEAAHITRDYLEKLTGDSFPDDLVAEDFRAEMKDFRDYFLKGKITPKKVLLGRPFRRGGEMQISLFLLDENRKGMAYLVKNQTDKWLMSGLEIDLREDLPALTAEKWMPALSPSLLGY